MRTKHGKLKGKGEIFRKQLCALHAGDESEETSESVEKEASLPRRVKDKNKSRAKVDDRSRRRKESRLEKSEEKRKKENKDSKLHQTLEQNTAIITKNRLTRHIGIYNKSKRSKTILRENLKEKLCSKKFQDVQAETEKDISRVLDCSSFGINSSGGVSNKSPAMQDTPENQKCSSIYHSPGSTGKQSYCNRNGKKETIPQNGNLEFKTPLQEISENLVQSLNPSDTFRGRNYLTEVQEQLRKLFKQSSVGLHQGRSQQSHSTPEVSSAVHRRFLKRKSEESVLMQHFTNVNIESNLEERLCTGQQQQGHDIPEMYQAQGENKLPQRDKIPSNTDAGSHCAPGLNFYVAHSNSRIPQGNTTRAAREEKENTNPFPADSGRVETNPNNHDYLPSTPHGPISAGKKDIMTSSPYDILDFLDCVGQHSIVPRNLPEQSEFGTPDLLEVSPPKKPTLESPSPQRKFYPRKLY